MAMKFYLFHVLIYIAPIRAFVSWSSDVERQKVVFLVNNAPIPVMQDNFEGVHESHSIRRLDTPLLNT